MCEPEGGEGKIVRKLSESIFQEAIPNLNNIKSKKKVHGKSIKHLNRQPSAQCYLL